MSIPTIDLVKTGQNITRLRLEKGLSVRDLQEIFGFTTPQAIYKWQHGDALPTVNNLVVLAQIYQVKLDDILVINQTSEQERFVVGEEKRNGTFCDNRGFDEGK